MNRKSYRKRLENMLKLRKDKRYRKGFISAAVMFDVITQREWERLTEQVENGDKAPVIMYGNEMIARFDMS